MDPPIKGKQPQKAAAPKPKKRVRIGKGSCCICD